MAAIRSKKERMIKSGREIAKIKKAVIYTENAMRYALSVFELGMTEKELANKIKNWARQRKLKVGFCLVQGDKRTSSIHGEPTKNKIRKILLIDLGLLYKGYFADITRTYLLKPDKKMKHVYSIVKKVHELAIFKATHGMYCRELDEFVRNEIKRSGYRLLHSTGHGIGLQVHEFPKIGKKSNHSLKKGMVFTIEPGIYIKGKFGVRIEDVFLMKNKIQKLSTIEIPNYD